MKNFAPVSQRYAAHIEKLNQRKDIRRKKSSDFYQKHPSQIKSDTKIYSKLKKSSAQSIWGGRQTKIPRSNEKRGHRKPLTARLAVHKGNRARGNRSLPGGVASAKY